ncbi:hypothetical protein HG536_0E02240 [Torulaspora globosa]|uniref:Uncharacterized protein n=1 Tax=Torulaspora globosa TaxID=48254 RepID=A0A7G3ZIH7_9SACH|nr:uncharacterized protein HG536_0E02240 [Torulaspora globosa]QLL33313.1 hypothetical protein HG536_0E02240 [Torulaspora globosa]
MATTSAPIAAPSPAAATFWLAASPSNELSPWLVEELLFLAVVAFGRLLNEVLNVVVVYGVDVDSVVETMEVVTSGVVVTSTYETLSAVAREAADAMAAMVTVAKNFIFSESECTVWLYASYDASYSFLRTIGLFISVAVGTWPAKTELESLLATRNVSRISHVNRRPTASW